MPKKNCGSCDLPCKGECLRKPSLTERESIKGRAEEEMHRHIDIQNALRILAHVTNGQNIRIDGDLVYLDGEFIGRTQEAPNILLKGGDMTATAEEIKTLKRFEIKFKVDDKTGCWVWTANTRGKYGMFSVKNRMKKSHRVSWELYRGSIPKGTGYHGTCVLHKCDNPLCVNPNHLFLGTNMDNMRDREIKGRGRITHFKGEDAPWAKLKEHEIHEILNDSRSQKLIAVSYGVSRSTISLVKRRKRWTHIQ